MKKFILILIFTIGAFSQSCKDMLEEKVVSGVTDKYYSTPAGFEDAVKASYSFLRSFYASELGMTLSVFGTDTYTMGSDGDWKFLNQYTSQLDPRTRLLRDIWNNFYRAINTANAVIDRAESVPGLSEQHKAKRTAEARFLRAHYYFILAQMFGDVHLSLKENTVVSTEASRTAVANIYDEIIKDLEFAAANLPVSPDNYGRATKPAAEHLLARVHLTRGTSTLLAGKKTGGTADDYVKAAAYAKKVINNYNLRLSPNFARVFDQGSGEINDEVIWSVQYTSEPLTNGGGNNAHLYFLMEYDVLPGMERDVQNGRPWKRFRPTEYTLETIFADRENDSRYSASFKTLFFANKPQGALAIGDTAVYLPGYDVSDETIASKPYLLVPPRKYTARLYPTLTKFLDPLRPDKTATAGSRDFLAFRLAETYLIASEALMLAGQAGEGAEYINNVRRRAAFPGKENQMEITADQLTLNYILEERGRELLGEQFRWFDLVRTGTLVERVRAYNPDAKNNIQDFHVLRPIPQDQIDRTSTSFLQNPGY
jgi:hypothetical protein